MSHDAAESEPIFTGSGASAEMVGWIDGVLVALREGRIDDARGALAGETWRTAEVETGLPAPIVEQAREALKRAADALARSSADEAEEALLIARSRFVPGA